MKLRITQGILLFGFICFFCSWNMPLSGTKTSVEKYQFTELFRVGVDEAIDSKDYPYQFSYIFSMDCDKKGNIYVLDYNEGFVRLFGPDGVFIVQLFKKGRGPQDLANPYSISVSPYSDHMFILQDYGMSIKEFKLNGEYVKHYPLPKQFSGFFKSVSKDEFIFVNRVSNQDQSNNFMKVNLSEKKVVQEFAPASTFSNYTSVQHFTIDKNLILWTARGNEMTLFAYDLKTGQMVQKIPIPGNFKKNTTTSEEKAGDMVATYVIYYNVAQPFLINDQLFVLIAIQDFQKKNGQIDRFPIKTQRFIFQVNGSHFEKIGELRDSEDLYMGTVFQNRLILYSNEPYGHFRVFEFKKGAKQ